MDKLHHAQNVADRKGFPVESKVLARQGEVDEANDVEDAHSYHFNQSFVFANLGDYQVEVHILRYSLVHGVLVDVVLWVNCCGLVEVGQLVL
jgi:hypothetical protein